MSSLLHLHRLKLAALLLAANLALLLHLAAGDLKPMAEWVWLDILGEGGSALLALAWLVLILKSRPAGRVSSLLALGLGCVFFSWWVDALDEFIRLPDSITWDSWLESAPMPIGLLLMTVGLYHWHHEQLAISAQLEKRERLFREHRLFDKLTPLGAAEYLRRQLQLSLQHAEQAQPLSLVAVDLDNFSALNQRFGHAEGDAVLQATGAVRMNYEILGNSEPELHCHLFPRYATEPEQHRKMPAWFYDWKTALPYAEDTHGALRTAIARLLDAPHR